MVGEKIHSYHIQVYSSKKASAFLKPLKTDNDLIYSSKVSPNVALKFY